MLRDVSVRAQTNDLILLYPDHDLVIFNYYRGKTDMEQELVPYADTGKKRFRLHTWRIIIEFRSCTIRARQMRRFPTTSSEDHIP